MDAQRYSRLRLAIFRLFDDFVQSQLPAALIKHSNPWYEYQLRTLRRRRVEVVEFPKFYLFSWGCLAPGALGVLTIFCSATILGQAVLFYSVLGLIGIPFFISIGLSILCNFYYVFVTINSLRLEFGSADLDLVRLTLVSEQDIVTAYRAVAQLRSWRAVVLELGLRLLIALVGIGSLTPLWFAAPGDFSSADDLIAFGAWTTILILLGMAYVLEPLWRMRTTTALATAIAVKVFNLTAAYLAAFLIIFAIVITQGSLVFVWLADLNHRLGSETVTSADRIGGIISTIVAASLFYLSLKIVPMFSVWWAVRTLRRGI